ncbi:MAG: HU family DNA-binding protein [Janthinobacterium lividum]
MATAKKAAKAPAAKKTVKTTASTKSTAAAKTDKSAVLKPVKDSFTKAGLAIHLSEQAGVEPKVVKSVLAALEATILGSIHKKGAREFALPGLLKIVAQSVPAKKKRFGKDPFTGEDRWFDAKPASVRIKVRALKKLKDAGL